MNINRYSRTYLYSFCVFLLGVQLSLSAQAPALDAFGNNESHPEWGAKGSAIRQITPFSFADGISAPNGADRPNPRDISNVLFAQDESIASNQELTDFIWVFGQFIDHEITLITNEPTEPLMIPVPPCDPVFDPMCQGNALIPMMRSRPREGTGNASDNPRRYTNEVTAFIDGSAVYGSDEKAAHWLRSFEEGKLKVSKGNFLPFNTIDGEINSPTDHSAPEMEVNNPDDRRWFVAGDLRANENIMLMAMHTLFVREHNRLCEELYAENPDWNDEQLYQKARSLVSGLIQRITYEEWLPAMGVTMDNYRGYQDDLDPNVSNVFSAAAFRFGHTLLSKDLLRMDDGCETIPAGDMTLREAFFAPYLIMESDLDPLFKGMSAQIQQELDCKVIDDVRNFLFGPPGAGIGMDLAAININRGRERGLPDYNAIRESLGLGRVKSFLEICLDPEEATILQELYQTVDRVDPWVGMLAEEHLPGAMFGESIMAIIKEQFRVLREGDRFHYRNNPLLSRDEKEWINQTALADVVKRNTGLEAIQENVFIREEVCKHESLDQQHLSLEIAPNPIVSEYRLSVYAFSEGDGTMRINDLFGRKIQEQVIPITKGVNVFEMYLPESLPIGVYNLTLQLTESTNAVKIMKVY